MVDGHRQLPSAEAVCHHRCDDYGSVHIHHDYQFVALKNPKNRWNAVLL